MVAVKPETQRDYEVWFAAQNAILDQAKPIVDSLTRHGAGGSETAGSRYLGMLQLIASLRDGVIRNELEWRRKQQQ